MNVAGPAPSTLIVKPVPVYTPGVRELLHIADPDDASIDSYVEKGACHGLYCEAQLVGVAVLLDTEPGIVELKNLAITPSCQGQGLGKLLLHHLIAEVRKIGYTQISVSTGNSSLGPIALYQKVGFRITGITPDYFIHHYPEPIEENGILCRDQIHLNLKLRD